MQPSAKASLPYRPSARLLWVQAVPVYGLGDAPGAPGVGLLASASGPVALVGPTLHCAPEALLQVRVCALAMTSP